MLEKDLQEFGLTKREATVYLALLSFGLATPTSLAGALSMQRSNIYTVLHSLQDKGLVHQELRSGHKLFAAEPPEKFEELARQKVAYAHSLLPQFGALAGEQSFRSKVQFYEGKKAMQNLFNDALKCKTKELLYLWSPKDMDKILEKKVIEKFIKERLAKKISLRSLRPAEKESFYQLESDTTVGKSLTQVAYVPEKYTFSLSIGLYDNKMVVFSSKKESFGFMLESREMAQVMRMFYDGLSSQSGKLRYQ